MIFLVIYFHIILWMLFFFRLITHFNCFLFYDQFLWIFNVFINSFWVNIIFLVLHVHISIVSAISFVWLKILCLIFGFLQSSLFYVFNMQNNYLRLYCREVLCNKIKSSNTNNISIIKYYLLNSICICNMHMHF